MKPVLLLPLALSACSASQKAVAAERELASIAATCRVPSSWLRLDGSELRLMPDPNARFEQVDCLLTELRRSGRFRSMPMGFVGNEAPAPEARD